MVSYENILLFEIRQLNFKLHTGKIIIYSGYPWRDGKIAEIIDLFNPEYNSDIYGLLEIGVDNAFGGKVGNEYISCGGFVGNV